MDKNDVIRLKSERLWVYGIIIKASNCLSANKISTEFKFFNASHETTQQNGVFVCNGVFAAHVFVC